VFVSSSFDVTLTLLDVRSATQPNCARLRKAAATKPKSAAVRNSRFAWRNALG